MNVHCISAQPSVLNEFITEIRHVSTQKDRMRFRRNIERIGEVLAYELSKTLAYTPTRVTTPLGVKEVAVLKDPLVICSVLRAGLPLHQGLLNYFDGAENAFISAYRHHHEGGEVFEIVVDYLAAPALNGKVLLLADPMLATGQSLVSVYQAMAHLGTPQEIHLVTVIGSTQGVEYVQKHFPPDTHLWIAAIDDTLNSKGYIVPGLGDAGDLAYGEKIQQ